MEACELGLLLTQMPRHLLVDVLEHRAGIMVRAFTQNAVALRLRISGTHRFLEFGGEGLVPLVAPLAKTDQMDLQSANWIAQRPVLPLITRAIAARIIACRMWCNPIGEKLDKCRPVIGTGAVGSPARNGVNREQVISVDPDAGNSEAD